MTIGQDPIALAVGDELKNEMAKALREGIREGTRDLGPSLADGNHPARKGPLTSPERK